MAFSREELRNIGIDNEKIDEVMSLHGKDVQELQDKEEQAKAKTKEAQQEVKLYKERVDAQEGQLDELKKQVGNGEDLNKQIEALKQANKEKDDEHQKEMNKVKLSYEIDKELDRTGAKNRIAVMALVNQDDVKLTDDGELKGLSEQLDELKQSDSYLFNDVDDSSNSDEQDEQDNDDKSSQNSNQNDSQNDGAFQYSAGKSKGNRGSQTSDETIGRNAAQRMFGKQED